jgi:hypothetical protein
MRSKSGEVTPEEIREPAVAGQFYPGDAEELRSEVEHLLQTAAYGERRPKKTIGEVIAGVVPHAGYMYSGAVAAKFYLLLSNIESTLVFLIAPSHREYFSAISVFCGMAYRTPLGDLPVNSQMAGELVSRGEPFINSWQGHRGEHALEVQLPFLQMLSADSTSSSAGLQIVPIVMGDQRPELCEQLGAALAEILNGCSGLIIASSDLSHYRTHKEARKLDRRILQCVKKLSPERLLEELENGRAEACGGGPIAATMMAARRLGATAGEILCYRDSSAVSGDEEQVVGYLSAAFYKT